MFKIGDKAVYPSQGVGIIQSIESREISGSNQIFYIFKTLTNDITIMIPTSNADSVGLRRIIGRETVPKIYEILREKEIITDGQTWNRRYKEYTEKIKSGSIYEVAEVLRNLFILKESKDLSFGEKKLMDTAFNLIVKEIAVAINQPESEVSQSIKSIFAY